MGDIIKIDQSIQEKLQIIKSLKQDDWCINYYIKIIFKNNSINLQ